MTQAAIVLLVCKAEGEAVVAQIETSGPLTEQVIRTNTTVSDGRRMPAMTTIRDGVQILCARCHSPLYFKGERGLLPAMPGSVEFLDDPQEEQRRERQSVARAQREEAEAQADRLAGRPPQGSA